MKRWEQNLCRTSYDWKCSEAELPPWEFRVKVLSHVSYSLIYSDSSTNPPRCHQNTAIEVARIAPTVPRAIGAVLINAGIRRQSALQPRDHTVYAKHTVPRTPLLTISVTPRLNQSLVVVGGDVPVMPCLPRSHCKQTSQVGAPMDEELG